MKLIVTLTALLFASSAFAQPSEEPRRARGLPGFESTPLLLTPAEAALGLAVAKVCANEASLRQSRPADCALIYQATRRHGDTAKEQLEWLVGHSSCVLGEEAPPASEMRGNCPWTRQLTRGDARPDAWEDEASWPRHAERWLAMLSFCERLASGHRPQGGWPCPRNPDTWGGGMDMARAERNGYTLVVCRGTANTGWMYPPWDWVRPTSIADTVTVLPADAK